MLKELVVLICVVGAVYGQSWTVVKPNYVNVGMSVDFQTDTDGFWVASSSSMEPLMMYTTDGGNTFTDETIDVSSAMFMSIRLDGSNGVAAGLGMSFFGLNCAASTTDGGKTWSSTGEYLLCASQSVDAVDGSLIMAGSFTESFGSTVEGLQVSTDGGNTWTARGWDIDTSARYVKFVNSTTGYLTGGMWPSSDEEKRSDLPAKRHRLSQNLQWNADHLEPVQYKRAERDDDEDGYIGVIAFTNDAGISYQTVLSLDNKGIYFNQIDCADADHCWAVGEGVDDDGEAIARVYTTHNGFSTYDTTTFDNTSLMAVSFLNSTYGWIGGAAPGSFNRPTGVLYLTIDGGKTWNLDGELTDFAVMDISVVDDAHAFAAGVTALGRSSLAAYK